MGHLPQIDNGKNPRAPLNIVNIPMFPNGTPFGNLNLKSLKIIKRIDRINIEIERVYDSYYLARQEDINNTQQDIMEHQFYMEQIIYWLRKTADEIISLAYVIDEWRMKGEWPKEIKIDSIAGLSQQPPPNLTELFAPFNEFLNTLNEVSNAFKHSFINTDFNLVGSEYPVVYALSLKRNKLSSDPVFSSLSFSEVINEFSGFYKTTIKKIQKCAEEVATARTNTA